MSTPFTYSTAQISELEKSLSAERLSGYVKQARGDRVLAVRLYERNTRLSEALYGVLQGFEVCLRNSLHRCLCATYGPDWYDHIPRLEYPLPERITEAKDAIVRHGKLLTPGRVVAELTFGCWTALIGPKYEKRLWVPCLHRAFPNAFRSAAGTRPRAARTKLSRADIASRIDAIRKLRNRIAHHEPILHHTLESEHCRILEAMQWICPVTAAWMELTSTFPERYGAPVA